MVTPVNKIQFYYFWIYNTSLYNLLVDIMLMVALSQMLNRLIIRWRDYCETKIDISLVVKNEIELNG